MFTFPKFLLQNTTRDYLWALGAFAGTIILFNLFKIIILKRLGKWADHTTTKIDDAIIKGVEDFGFLFYVLLGLQIAFQFVKLPSLLEQTVYYLTLIVVVYYLTRGLNRLVEQGIKSMAQSKDRDQKASVVQILIRISKGALWIIAFLLVLSNLGYNITSLLAGVGISGIAIAFALRSILEDLFSAFSIYFDKPFQPGDFIVIGNDKGTIQSIGLKSTRIQTLQGEQLIIPNQELTKARVHNYKRMEKRRRTFEFGVTYNTSSKKLERIPEMVEKIIKDTEMVKFDRVFFTEFGDSSLKFEAVYHVNSPEMKDALAAQQKINLVLKKKFNQENIEMAYPTQTIHLEQ